MHQWYRIWSLVISGVERISFVFLRDGIGGLSGIASSVAVGFNFG